MEEADGNVVQEAQDSNEHVCIICWRLLRLTYHQSKNVWSMTQATTHIKKYGCYQKARVSFKNKDDTKNSNASCYP